MWPVDTILGHVDTKQFFNYSEFQGQHWTVLLRTNAVQAIYTNLNWVYTRAHALIQGKGNGMDVNTWKELYCDPPQYPFIGW